MAMKPKTSTAIPVHVDVCLHEASSAKPPAVAKRIKALLDDDRVLRSQPLDVSPDVLLASHCLKASVAVPRRFEDTGVASWKAKVIVNTYKLNHDIGSEHLDDEDTTSAYQQFVLPHVSFEGLWENLHFDSGLKEDLVSYASSAMVFAQKRVDQSVVACNRMILLYGPPGTGKTTLCKSLAQQLSIRLQNHYPQTILVEINSHSLFSKWFSESGKLIQRLFTYLEDFVNDEENLVCILIDEVESLAMSRQNAVASNEPADSVRAVNALLTQLDKLSRRHNVLLLTTTNITTAIDDAFLDRADVRRFVGYPGTRGRYEVLSSCVSEMTHKGVLSTHVTAEEAIVTKLPSSVNARATSSSATVDDDLRAVVLPLPSLISALGSLRVRVNARWVRSTGLISTSTTTAPSASTTSPTPAPTLIGATTSGVANLEAAPMLSLPLSTLVSYYDALSLTDLSSMSATQLALHEQYCTYAQWLLFFTVEEVLAHVQHYSSYIATKDSQCGALPPNLSFVSGATRSVVPSSLCVVENITALYEELSLGKRISGIIEKAANPAVSNSHRPSVLASISVSLLLLSASIYARGLSGRSLRKLPFQAHSLGMSGDSSIISKGSSGASAGAMDSLEALMAAGEVSVAGGAGRTGYMGFAGDDVTTYCLASNLGLQSLPVSGSAIDAKAVVMCDENSLCGSEHYLAFLHVNNNMALPRDTVLTARDSMLATHATYASSRYPAPNNTRLRLSPLPSTVSFSVYSENGCAIPLDVYLYALRCAVSVRKAA